MIFETHAHYDDEAFDGDRDSLLASMQQNNIGWLVNVGASLKTTRSSIQLAEQYPFVYAAAGVHPSESAALDETQFEWLREQCAHPKVVAVGEIGLDYYWEEMCIRDRPCGSEEMVCAPARACKIGQKAGYHSFQRRREGYL